MGWIDPMSLMHIETCNPKMFTNTRNPNLINGLRLHLRHLYKSNMLFCYTTLCFSLYIQITYFFFFFTLYYAAEPTLNARLEKRRK